MYTKSAALYDTVYSFKDYQSEAEILRGMIEAHKKSDGADLLDLACGTGAHIAFLRTHYKIVGIDLDPQMIEIARRKFPEVTFHVADMTDFSLEQRFDAMVCLFSSIGYLKEQDRLFAAVQNMADHLKPGGVLAIEPWFSPEIFKPGTVHATFVDQPELKIARMNISQQVGNYSVFDFHYLVATPEKIEHFTERHELGLFTHDQYMRAYELAGLDAFHDPEGLSGRGMYLGVAPA
jgi:ubiquinone/menaquinone biosynthesis C-methylase UbiE